MFRPVEGAVSFPKLEESIIRFWKERQIYEKSLAARRDAPPFVFYEGPPTANGLPHPGHCLTRSIKDLFPRYRTMRGYRCDRKAGWDTHGLPVEVEVCKDLGIHSKEEIERYGVEPFIRKCVESVFRYTRQWEHLTERLGFWIHLDEAYVTFHQSYVESVWWALKTLFERGLLYQGHKIVWWWAQGGTALSSGEVGQGYREVADPAVYVRFPLLDDEGGQTDTDLVVWTTTPWTLPSNQFAAVKPDLEYVVAEIEGDPRKIVVARALFDALAAKLAKDAAHEGSKSKEFAPEAGKDKSAPREGAKKHGAAATGAPVPARIVETLPGSRLVGRRYRPPFEYYYRSLGDVRGRLLAGGEEHLMWRVVAAEFVTVDTGTGVVHQAPAFGEVDFEVLQAERARFFDGEGPDLLCAVSPDGTFTAAAPDYIGRWVKDCDRDIIRWLKGQGLLLHQEQYLHDYPFCWRADEDPLIQYPRKSWFVRTTQFREAMLANNRLVHWLPEHIRDGRFGNFLESNVDWALSRERYWGTPLPIWVCEKTGYMEAVANYAELLAKPGVAGTEVWEKAKRESPELPDALKVHKPYIDAVTYDSPQSPSARMRRVSEVIDCWFDSGAMPFAQWGYPATPGAAERWQQQFPADFISEAIDQTRGWFYSLLAISTLLFGPQPKNGDGAQITATEEVGGGGRVTLPGDAHVERAGRAGSATAEIEFPHPFRNCIVLGLMLGEDGQKMSKSKRNYREPNEIFDRYGADALRWYFFAKQPPWTSIRYNEQAIKECIPEFLLRLWNVYSFFVIYANIDGFDPATRLAAPAAARSSCSAADACENISELAGAALAGAEGYRPIRERAELDRWILSELSRTSATVTERMDAYDNYAACARLHEFADALSNWYVRRSRDRFWAGDSTPDKLDAYWTLYECLITLSKLVAPFTPFVAEAMWQNLAVAAFGPRVAESVHLCQYPTGNVQAVDEELSQRMAVVREVVSLGRSARMAAKLKVRQPLALVELILADRSNESWLGEHVGLICDELNVKRVEFARNAEQYISYTVLPDLKRLGPRLGKQLPAVKKALGECDAARLLADLEGNGRVTLALPEGSATLDPSDVQVRLQAKDGWAAAQGRACVVVLSTEITPALIREGLARELVRIVQDTRKEMGLAFTDRIRVVFCTASTELRQAVDEHGAYIAGETLAVELAPVAADDGMTKIDVAGHTAGLAIERAATNRAP